MFLPSVVSFYKKTSISLSNITKPSLKKTFCFHLNRKWYPIIVPCVLPLGFWSESIAIRYASYHFQNRSVPIPLHYENNAEKNQFQWKQKVYPIWKLEQSDSDPTWWKPKQHHISLNRQFTVVLNNIIYFSVRFRDNSVLVVKMCFQVFSFTGKKVQGLSSDKKILISLLSVKSTWFPKELR